MNFIKLILLAYILIYLSTIFFWRIYTTWRKIGANPVKYNSKDSAHNYVGRLFLIILIFSITNVLIYVYSDGIYRFLIPIDFLNFRLFQIIGLFLAWFSLFWVFVAQSQMGKDWRIGIDQYHKPKIYFTGLFNYSRHPIYFGVIITSLALFLIMPNVANLFLFILTFITLNIQARLEEEYMLHIKYKEYLSYMTKTPRWF